MPENSVHGGIWAALAGLIFVVTQILQSAWQEYRNNRREVRLHAATAQAAAQLAEKTEQTAGKVDSVYQAMNGQGLAGKLDEIAQWQETHEKNDVKRFAEMHAFLKQFSPPPCKGTAGESRPNEPI